MVKVGLRSATQQAQLAVGDVGDELGYRRY